MKICQFKEDGLKSLGRYDSSQFLPFIELIYLRSPELHFNQILIIPVPV